MQCMCQPIGPRAPSKRFSPGSTRIRRSQMRRAGFIMTRPDVKTSERGSKGRPSSIVFRGTAQRGHRGFHGTAFASPVGDQSVFFDLGGFIMVSLNCVKRSNRDSAARSRSDNPLLKLHRAVNVADCHSIVERSRCRKLVVDCSGVEMMSSDTLGRLLVLQRRMRKSGGRLVLSGLREEVRQMFAWTKLERCFEIQAAADRERLLPVTVY